MGGVAEGILAGAWAEELVLEVNSSYIHHGDPSEEVGPNPVTKAPTPHRQGEPRLEELDIDWAQEESAGRGVPRFAISPETTYVHTVDDVVRGTYRAVPTDYADAHAATDAEGDVLELTPEREVTCPACLGKHRQHTRDVHCILGPAPPALTAEWGPFAIVEPIASEGAEADEGGSVDHFSCPACRGRHRRHR